METYFATPHRSDKDELHQQIKDAVNNPVIDSLLTLAGGLVAVLNQNRQIVTVNHRLMEAMGVTNPAELIGLRPGEALGCVYADQTEAGCGTSPYCVTCGAAIAIVSTLGTHGSVERKCSITIEQQGRPVDLYFQVRAETFKHHSDRFVIIFLHDITQQQHHAALERTFFHDIKNTMMGLVNVSELLSLKAANQSDDQSVDLTQQLNGLVKTLFKEVEWQHHLCKKGDSAVDVSPESLPIDQIVREAEALVMHHPARKGHQLIVSNDTSGSYVRTDRPLLLRVLGNMLINAFEADENPSEVRLDVTEKTREVIFSVWNKDSISLSVSHRIFQRNFSTKGELGRGLGTYSMKIIGEQMLGGRVYFCTSPNQGTQFFIALPKSTGRQSR